MPWSIFREGGGDGNAVAWAKQLLTMIGAPVTPGNTEFIYQWEKAEGGGGKYNPLNQGPVPGHPELTTTGQQYGGGAADFASWQAGLQGAVDYLNMPYYRDVLSNLKSNNPVAARTALWKSPWASSHYGYGKNWPNVPLPGNAAPTLDFSTAAATGTDAAQSSKSDPTCAIGFSTSGIKIPLGIWNPSIGGGDYCFISKSAARGLLGGIILGVGLGVSALGVALVLKYGFGSDAMQSIAGKATAPIRKGGSIEGKARTRLAARREQPAP